MIIFSGSFTNEKSIIIRCFALTYNVSCCSCESPKGGLHGRCRRIIFFSVYFFSRLFGTVPRFLGTNCLELDSYGGAYVVSNQTPRWTQKPCVPLCFTHHSWFWLLCSPVNTMKHIASVKRILTPFCSAPTLLATLLRIRLGSLLLWEKGYRTSGRWSVWSVWSMPTPWSRSFRADRLLICMICMICMI